MNNLRWTFGTTGPRVNIKVQFCAYSMYEILSFVDNYWDKIIRFFFMTALRDEEAEMDTKQCDYALFTYVTFCIKCPSHSFWSNSTFETAPTVMYCILSSFKQENHKSFQIQFTLIMYWLFCCGHLQRGYCNMKKQLSYRKSSVHEVKRRFIFKY